MKKILIILSICILFTACSKSDNKIIESEMVTTILPIDDNAVTLSPDIANPNEVGNTTGNIWNGGAAAIQNDWIYYNNFNDNGYLYKIRTDGSDKIKLNNDNSHYINVIGDWIYYCTEDESSNLSIYKIHTDGSERTKLNSDRSQYMFAFKEWIYYGNTDDDSSIYKIKTDGSERTKLNDDRSGAINIIGDWIYYSNHGGGTYKIRTDGSERTKLNDDNSFYICVVGDWVYYTDYNTHGDSYSYRIRTDGTERQFVD